MDSLIKQAAKKIKEAKSIVVFTGAGISKASGISTFRGKDGLWHNNSQRELSTFDSFVKNPKLVWQWYNQRKKQIKESKPNIAHLSAAELEDMFQDRFTLITQNIDSLHKQAGNKNILNLHGSIFESRCMRCGKVYEDYTIYKDEELVPKCKFCKEGSIRPNVVLFGESLDRDILKEASKKAANCGVFIAVGTSGVVQPAAGIPKIAHDSRAFVIDINVEYSGISIYSDITILQESEKVMSSILKYLKS